MMKASTGEKGDGPELESMERKHIREAMEGSQWKGGNGREAMEGRQCKGGNGREAMEGRQWRGGIGGEEMEGIYKTCMESGGKL